MPTYYAWSDLYNGGTAEKMTAANGAERTVIKERNVIERGAKVTQKELGVSDEEFEYLVASGSVREYPLPEGADDTIAPHRAVLAELVDENGDIDVNKLLQMGATSVQALTQLPAPINPPASEGATVEDSPKPKGA